MFFVLLTGPTGFNPKPQSLGYAPKKGSAKGREASRWISHLPSRKKKYTIETCYNCPQLPRC